MKSLIISIALLIVVGSSYYMWNKNEDQSEAPYAAGINLELDDVEPFLRHLSSSIFDSGFTKEDIESVQSKIESMENYEVKEIGIFDITYKGKSTKIRLEAEIHYEDVEKEVVLYMFSIQEVVNILDEEMMKIEEE